jgi:hypothetical protein
MVLAVILKPQRTSSDAKLRHWEEVEMSESLRKLETAVMELGSEVYTLRNQMIKTKDLNERLVKMFECLRKVLDEKNVITREEFDLSVVMDQLPDAEGQVIWSDLEDDAKKYSH